MLYNHIEQILHIAKEKSMREENTSIVCHALACMPSEKNIYKIKRPNIASCSMCE
jgi:hypothetical protein